MTVAAITVPLDANNCPDLQQLVRDAGGYQNITPEIWAAFDNAMRIWHAQYRGGLMPAPPVQQQKQRSKR
jgi:hypothetical protein